MINFTKRFIRANLGNPDDMKYIQDALSQNRFMRTNKFLGFMLATNIVPLIYFLIYNTKAGDLNILEESRMKARFKKWVSLKHWPSFMNPHVEQYLLQDNLESFKDIEIELKKDEEEKEYTISEKILASSEENLSEKNLDSILCPLDGTILNFTEIIDNDFEISPGLNMSLQNFLSGDKYLKFTEEDIEELKLQKEKKSKIYAFTIVNKDLLSCRIYNPTDFEINNVVH